MSAECQKELLTGNSLNFMDSRRDLLQASRLKEDLKTKAYLRPKG